MGERIHINLLSRGKRIYLVEIFLVERLGLLLDLILNIIFVIKLLHIVVINYVALHLNVNLNYKNYNKQKFYKFN